MAKADFDALVARAMAMPGRAHMRPVIEKELLHYDMLFALDQGGLLDRITFQGGTSLRLCHGSPRFSEDLDFAGGPDFKSEDLIAIKGCLEEYLGARYDLQVSVKEPREMAVDRAERGLNVDCWQVSIQTAPARPDLPRQRIKFEVANVPAYTGELTSLRTNYDFLPDGYAETLLRVESLDEVFADKLLSYAVSSYPRYRDIWDLQWLEQQGAKLNADLLRNKITDYRVQDYPVRAENAIRALSDQVHSREFSDTMLRFLPQEVQERTLLREGFLDYLTKQVEGHLENALTALRTPAGTKAEPPFRM
ncbi:hypothetical protein CEK62_04095 [Alcanivorax sp. N3-2A]|nr:hypothetical protein CEK62_04095 [Alcanivorax sp. N3-2A]